MKKYLSMITLSTALLLTGCGSKEDEAGLVDGTYEIKDTEYDEGYLEGLTMTVTDGEVSDAKWSSVDEDGNEKIEDEDYQELMTEHAGVGPQEFMPELEDQLVEKQDAEEIEAVSGATSTSAKFKEYAEELLKAAEEGNTDVIEK